MSNPYSYPTMPGPSTVSPVLKWPGGKRQLLRQIYPLLPKHFSFYCEPFLGGGALFFALKPSFAIVNDINKDLIEMYGVIRNDVDLLIESLNKHKNTKEYFYKIRNLDRDPILYHSLSPVERASRLIFLNKTCFNGLYRVNSSGQFNSPYGYYEHPNITNEDVLHAVSLYLNRNKISFRCEDFSKILACLPFDSFVYLDPPYDPISKTSDFTSYTKHGFTRMDQIRLKECCDNLSDQGGKFMLSNSATPFMLNLYSNYHIHILSANRSINSDAKRRGQVSEILVTNY